MIAAKGLAGLKTRELARDIGCANGAVYNLVEDVDDLVLRVGSRTLARLDAALTAAEARRPGDTGRDACRGLPSLIAISQRKTPNSGARCSSTACSRERTVPEWAIAEQMELFRHIHRPLAALFRSVRRPNSALWRAACFRPFTGWSHSASSRSSLPSRSMV